MRIVVAHAQVPFAHGGAEVLAERLTEELNARDHQAALVTVPFKWYPRERVLESAFVWRMLDLEEVEGRKVDLLIATKFPSYAVRHPRKRVWLVHQFRQAYDLDRTELGEFGETAVDRATRRKIHELDRRTLGEAEKRFAISQNVADRLRDALGLDAEVVLPPPQELDYRFEEYGDFVLSVGRLDRAKRVDLLLEAAAGDPSLRVVVAGDGPDRARLEDVARSHELNGQVEFRGRVDADELADLYARAGAVYYAPIDEDYGMVPYEAFLSEKPVVTTTDAGGPLDVVADRRTGLVTEPRARDLAAALRHLREHPDDRQAWGRAGKAKAETVTWDAAIDRLLS
jgi:glycosyltransferase involved in cell wall biosynthesis